ncbi:hypothetical protein [Epilithonimonas sp. UC225_85]|uniref:hypothetical protein n=1 Tax=Epilithonimonas sp. UC225_85 TaxID=3350167 RepID=UPI0036D281F7
MRKDAKSSNAQVGMETVFLKKIQRLFVLFFVFLISLFSAQEKPEGQINTNTVITVTGDAFIYSKDKAFNDQIRNNKSIKATSEIVELSNNTVLKITAKNAGKSPKLISKKKKSKNIVLASKRENKYKSETYPKKDTNLQIKNTDEGNQFLTGSYSARISFVPPTNDSSLSKYFINYNVRLENISLVFSLYINHFYKTNNSKLQVFSNVFSVRPPPGLI